MLEGCARGGRKGHDDRMSTPSPPSSAHHAQSLYLEKGDEFANKANREKQKRVTRRKKCPGGKRQRLQDCMQAGALSLCLDRHGLAGGMMGKDERLRWQCQKEELSASTYQHPCTEYWVVCRHFLQPNDPHGTCIVSPGYQVAERTAGHRTGLAVPGPAQVSIMLASLDVFQRSAAEVETRFLNHSGAGNNV